MGTLGSFLVIFSTFVTVVTFGTPVAFWYTEIGSVLVYQASFLVSFGTLVAVASGGLKSIK